MKTETITFRNQQYKITSLTPSGTGMINSRWMMPYTDAQMYKIAKKHPSDIKMKKVSA